MRRVCAESLAGWFGAMPMGNALNQPALAESPARKTLHAGLSRWRQVMLGLQVRYTVRVVGLALIVGLIAGGLTLDFCAQLVRRLHRDHCIQTAALMATKAASSYSAGPGALQELSERMVRTESLLFVAFMDADGRGLAAARHGKPAGRGRDLLTFTPSSTLGLPQLVAAADGRPPYLDITYPVRSLTTGSRGSAESAAPLIGYVRLGLSLEQTYADAASTAELLIGLGVLVLACTCFTGFLLVRWFIAPLQSLAHTMGRLADGDLHARCQVQRKDEIGELAAAYNVMADKLAQKHEEITLLNAELEERVQQRTRQLRDLAARDPLTGLYNRRHFAEVVQSQAAAAQRYGQDLSCMMLDLDDFKAVNDELGHQRGDELLILVAVTITTELRRSDLAARYGGDEFIILLPGTGPAEGRILAERMLEKLRAAVGQQLPDCRIGISIGIASLNELNAGGADELIRAADNAMYLAKAGGKNCIAEAGDAVQAVPAGEPSPDA